MDTRTIHRAALETAPRWAGVLAALLVLFGQPAQAQLANTPWPKYAGNLHNTGQSAYGGDGTSWDYNIGERASGSPTIADDGTIYFMAKSGSHQYLHALNPDGSAVGGPWPKQIQKGSGMQPVIGADGTIYVGVEEDETPPDDSELHAIRPDGTTAWVASVPDLISPPTVMANGDLLVDGLSYSYYINASTGGIEWTLNKAGKSVPAVWTDGRSYITHFDGSAAQILALDASGNPEEIYTSNAFRFWTMALSDEGIAYVTGLQGSNPKLFAIDIVNKELDWEADLNGNAFLPILGPYGRVCVRADRGTEGDLQCFDTADGTEIWSRTLDGDLSIPALSNAQVLYVTGDRPSGDKLYAVDAETGTLLREEVLVQEPKTHQPVIAGDGTVYIASESGLMAVSGSMLSIASIDFGEREAGTTETQSITLRNEGGIAVNLASVSIVGPDAAEFTISGPIPAGALMPGGQVTVDVTFEPALSAGDAARSAQLRAETDGGTVYGELTGTMTTPPMPLAASPSSHDFGFVQVGSTSSEQIITIENTGTINLSILSLTLNVGSGITKSSDTGELVLLPGATRKVGVTFAPSAKGVSSASVEVETLAGTLTTNVTGTGVVPLNVSSGALDLGEGPVGSTPKTATVTVENPNVVNVSLFSASVSGDSEGNFAVSTSAGGVLPAGGTATVSASFDPKSAGNKSALLNIQSAVGGMTLGLQGTGLKMPVLSDAALSFGSVEQGSTVERSATLTNDGPFDVELVDVAVQGAQSAAYTVTQGSPGTIAAGATQQIKVAFAPGSGGSRTASLALTLDIGTTTTVEQTLTVALDGVSIVPPQLTAAATALDFGAAAMGTSTIQTFTLQNTGGAPLDITDATATGADAFSISGPMPKTLGAGETVEYVVTFTPGTSGALSSDLQITSSAGSVNIRLDGVGVGAVLSAPERVAVGTEADITVDLSGGYLPGAERELCYRRSGERTYQCASFTTQNAGAQLAASIPAAYVTERGVDYYIALSDGAVALTIPAARPADEPRHIETYFEQIRMPGRFVREQYRMISTPAELDASLAAALEESYGPPRASEWRLMRWDPRRQVYQEYMGGETLDRGESAWLVSRFEEPPQLGRGRSVDASEPFEIVVEPGWNQVASPFPFPVAWSDVEGSAEVQAPVQHNGIEYEHNQEALRPWGGSFVYNPTPSPITLVVPPKEAATPTTTAQAKTTRPSYTVQLSAYLEGTPLRDTQNFLGFVSGSRADVQMEAPPVSDHVRLSLVQGTERHAISHQPIAPGGHAWDMEVGAHTAKGVPAGKPIRVRISEQGKRPQGFQLYILDADRRVRVPVSDEAFTVELNADQPVRTFRVVVGTEDFASAHSDGIPLDVFEYGLEANYPNPFKQETMIRYKLREPSSVTLDVYNILGQRVARLVDERQGAGPHTARWNGRDERGVRVASGVYFYRLVAGPFSASGKMVVVR